MRIANVSVRNFRNLAEVDVPLQRGTVLVGENRVGKSNFIHALRLVLDPNLPNSERYLRAEDFSDALSDGSPGWDPMAAGEEIEIAIDFSEFADEPEALCALAEALIEGDPMTARITYRYAPRAESADGDRLIYEWRIYGGDRPDTYVPPDLRRYIWVAYLQALRDAQGDLASWNRSPLRPLLQAAADSASATELLAAAEAITEAQAKVTELQPVKELAEAISKQCALMVGENQALEAELGIAPLEPMRLIRSLRIFIDGGAHRSLGSASLGTLNVLYLALLELDLEQRLKAAEIAHVLMAIEEPEAHLHPHLQRLIFRRLLRDETSTRSVVVTTHSPHIASVADPRGLVVFRTVDGQTEAAAASDADLEENEWEDIQRYLDSTRSEMVFARRVLLVEGFSEQVLLPVLAVAAGIDLDKHGVTVCAIHGTHFASYVGFLSALHIPWAVLTDGDPRTDGKPSLGSARAARLLKRLGREGEPEDEGIFVGETTFELDLLDQGDNEEVFLEVLHELAPSERSRQLVKEWREDIPDAAELMKLVERIGKGRVAQRLARAELDIPPYVREALRYLIDS